MKQLIAVSLIGIPGSGKTSLAHKLLEMSRTQQINTSVVVINFDEYIKLNFSHLRTGDYKQSREGLLQSIEELLKENCLIEKLKTLVDEKYFNINDGRSTLIILDDNNYFRSMRQRIRSICRQAKCGYFQIFVKSSIDEAIARNMRRSNQVPESVIKKIFNLLEEPQNHRTIHFDHETTNDELVELINDRMKNPENLQQVTLSFPQQQSLLHEIDIVTRKEISVRIKALQTKDISTNCEMLNKKRKQFLEDLRTQSLDTADLESLRTAFHQYLDK